MEYKAISLFSGGMGLDLGLEKAGIDVRLCLDFDKFCCETIRKNRPNVPVLEGKVENYTSK
jgi:DNA (cytosine-5)-methyltransferase 1